MCPLASKCNGIDSGIKNNEIPVTIIGDSNSIKNKIDKMLFTLNLFICFYFIIYLQSLHDNLVISAAIL